MGSGADTTRRKVVKAAASAIGLGLGAGGVLASTERGPLPRRVKARVKHLFVLMLENRSFDHLLGWSAIPGVDGAGPRSVRGAADRLSRDPPHELPDVCVQLTGKPDWDSSAPVTMRGFSGSEAFGSFDPACAPVLTTLARSYAVCNRWFSSMPGPTWPNRFFVHAGSSGGLDNSPSSFRSLRSVAFDKLGFDFENGSVFKRLAPARWRCYHGDAFPQVLAIKGVDKPWFWGNANFRKLHRLVEDLQRDAGSMPAYVFIEPDYGVIRNFAHGNSQHPVGSVAAGEHLIRGVYLALRRSPIWEQSALIITYDEHGGFYDHVVPDPAVPPGDRAHNHLRAQFPGRFDFSRLGVRVPAVVISPWTAPQVVTGTLDHTCILRTLDDLFGTGSFTPRDRTAQSLVGLFSGPFRKDAPADLPAVVQCAAGALREYAPAPTTAELLEREALARVQGAQSAIVPAPDETGDGVLDGFARIAHMVDRTMRERAPGYDFKSELPLETAADARAYILAVAQGLERYRLQRAGQPLL